MTNQPKNKYLIAEVTYNDDDAWKTIDESNFEEYYGHDIESAIEEWGLRASQEDCFENERRVIVVKDVDGTRRQFTVYADVTVDFDIDEVEE